MKDVFILDHFTRKTLYHFGAVVFSFVAHNVVLWKRQMKSVNQM